MLGRRERSTEGPEGTRANGIPPVSLVLYTRKACPLCDEMKAEVERARPSIPFELREIDVDHDPALVARFGLSVPVLEIEGRVAFEGRLNARDFVRELAQERDDRGGRGAR